MIEALALWRLLTNRFVLPLLTAGAAWLGGYHAGVDHADKRAQVAVVAELRRRTEATAKVVSAAGEREREASDRAASLQERIDDYTKQLARRDAVSAKSTHATRQGDGCALSDGDVERMRGFSPSFRSNATPRAAR